MKNKLIRSERHFTWQPMAASHSLDIVCIEKLACVSPHIQSTDGRTVLMICAGNETVLQAFLGTFHGIGENPESVNMKDAAGRTMLMINLRWNRRHGCCGNVDQIWSRY